MDPTLDPKQPHRFLHRLIMGVVLLTLLVVIAAGYSLYRAQQRAATKITPIYHGGACDSPAYYSRHLRECSVQ